MVLGKQEVFPSAIPELKSTSEEKNPDSDIESSMKDAFEEGLPKGAAEDNGRGGFLGLTVVTTLRSTLTSTVFFATTTVQSTITVACVPPASFGLHQC
ncbi:hypothetical protein QYM36_004838 [Artemia franciscana]|uniref:Uncharacterized protein n=2 Tax=Artemia franciscana TaxID=6661 RepID=A0AA88IC27_ARTSF|nr:hypothetical protein QYM36_004838 [Artemia franciscana]